MTYVEFPEPRPPRRGPGHDLGIDEDLIRKVVFGFYARVRADEKLQGIFNREIADRWDPHLEKMCDFWSSVLLLTGRFKGTPMQAHAKIPDIQGSHFDHWQHLFAQTTKDLCTAEQADLFQSKAQMIGQSLQMGIAISRGEFPPLSVKKA